MCLRAGFCLGEGLVDSRDDFLTIGYCQDLDPNVIDVKISPDRLEKISDLLDRRGFISQTSCGICGKEMVKDLYQIISPIEDKTKISIDKVLECIKHLPEHQNHYNQTTLRHVNYRFFYKDSDARRVAGHMFLHFRW